MLCMKISLRPEQSPDLDAGVEVVEDVVVLQLAMSVIVEVHAHLLTRMYSIPPENRRGACCYPDAGQCVSVNFILLYQPLSLLVYVDTSVLSVVNLVVPHYRITVCTDLYASQCVTCILNQMISNMPIDLIYRSLPMSHYCLYLVCCQLYLL